MLAQDAFNSGDTAWVLVCATLVLFMTPGLAAFYGGMVRTRNTLAMLQQNMIALGVVSLTWILLGYTIAFGDSTASGLFGDLELFGLIGLDVPPAPAFRVVAGGVTIPALVFVAYQMMFAVITPALITGATAARLTFAGWAVFLAIWSVIVYAPVAHWLWHPDGWLASLGAQDWAGGMVVHASAGAAVLAVLLVVGRRAGWPKTGALPNSIPLTIVGAGILWFGWFGFNSGSAFAADGVAVQAWLNTFLAAAAAGLAWCLVERLRDGHVTSLGAASGIVAGLVAITPGAGFVAGTAPLIIGAIAGVVCCYAVRLKFRAGYDDSLDVVGVHMVGGLVGSLLIGFFARPGFFGGDFEAGLFHGGDAGLLVEQLIANVVTMVFAFVVTYLIMKVLDLTIGVRADADAETAGLDLSQHAETAYRLADTAMERR